MSTSCRTTCTITVRAEMRSPVDASEFGAPPSVRSQASDPPSQTQPNRQKLAVCSPIEPTARPSGRSGSSAKTNGARTSPAASAKWAIEPSSSI
jgi:hypothetical protein